MLQEQHARSAEHLHFELASAEQQIAEARREVSALRATTEASDVRTQRLMASNRLLNEQLALADRQIEELKRIASAPRDKRPDALKDIALGTAAVHCPERMKQGVEYDLTAAVSMIQKDAALLQQIGGPNSSSGAWETPVAKTMAVWVEAPAFAVKPEKQDRQLVIGTPAKWMWKVRPLRAGKQRILVHAAMVLQVDGVETQRVFQLPPREITVDVDHLYEPAQFAKSNWQWLMSVIFIPSLLFAYRRGVKREQKKQQAGFNPKATA